MKKGNSTMMLLLTLILGLTLQFGCAPKAEEKKPVLGNSNGNIANMGMSATDGDWIYFLNAKENGALYKMKKDGSQESLVSQDQAGFLNYMAGYVYYCNAKEDSKIFRVKPDGTERTLISDFASSNLMVDGESIYAIDNTKTDDPTAAQRLYRSKLDGTGRTMVGQAAVAQFNLVGDTIYYIAAGDRSLHRMKTDGTADTTIGNGKPKTIIAGGDKIYFTDSQSEDNQIWSVGTDGTGAVRLSEDKTAAFNVSGDWIYYSHPKDEMLSFEFKKMKLDGSESSVVNADMPVVITVHDDFLGYLQMDLSTFSMSQVFVKTDGTGRKEFRMSPENTVPEKPGEDPSNDQGEIYNKNEKVVGQGMTVTVDHLYVTNLLGTEMRPVESFLQSRQDNPNFNVFITFTVTNDGEEPLELYQKVGIVGHNSKDGGKYTQWCRLADVTERMAEIQKTDFLMGTEIGESDYTESVVIQPRATRIIQAEGSLEGRNFPLNFSLFDKNEKPYANILVEPDKVDWAIKPDVARQIIEKKFGDDDVEIKALKATFTRSDGQAQLFYPFEVKDSKKVEYLLVNGFTEEIFNGELKDGQVLPLEIVKDPPKEQSPDDKKKVVGQGMTVTVDHLYVTNLLGTEMIPLASFLQSPYEDINVFITFTVTNDGEEPLELYRKVGIVGHNSKDGGKYTQWCRLADVTERMAEIRKTDFLMGTDIGESDYTESVVIQPRATRIIQAEGSLEVRTFPLNFSLFGKNEKPYANILVEPDKVDWAIKPDMARQIIEKEFGSDDVEIKALKATFTRSDGQAQLFYPFELKGKTKDRVVYLLVNGFTKEIFKGELVDGRVIPGKPLE